MDYWNLELENSGIRTSEFLLSRVKEIPKIKNPHHNNNTLFIIIIIN